MVPSKERRMGHGTGAKKRGLPTNGTAPLGYQFRYQDLNGKRIPVALEPDSN